MYLPGKSEIRFAASGVARSESVPAPAAHDVQHGRSVSNSDGAHDVAAGLNATIEVAIQGHAGYYAAGMNQIAKVTIKGSAGTGVAENMMSGMVHVKGFASNAAGASARGGLLIIDGDAGLRCGISLKGADIVVGGSVGSSSAFMAQAGNLVILGDAGEALGDSLYEVRIFVRGKVHSLGADCGKNLGKETARFSPNCLPEAGHRDVSPELPSSSVQRAPLQLPCRSCWSILNEDHRKRYLAFLPHLTRTALPKFAVPRPLASTIFAGEAPNASCQISTTCCFSAPRSAVIRWKAIAKNAAQMLFWAHALPKNLST